MRRRLSRLLFSILWDLGDWCMRTASRFDHSGVEFREVTVSPGFSCTVERTSLPMSSSSTAGSAAANLTWITPAQ